MITDKFTQPIRVRPQTVQRLREMLEQHLGARGWTDAEVEQMAITMMRTFAVLLSMPDPTTTGRAANANDNTITYDSTTTLGDVPAQEQ